MSKPESEVIMSEYPYWVVEQRDAASDVWDFYTGDAFPCLEDAEHQIDLAVSFCRGRRENFRIVRCRIEVEPQGGGE